MSPRSPDGMRGATAIRSSSVSTDLAAYEDLPGHHLLSIRNLITTSPDELYPDSDSEDLRWDYSGLQDTEAFRQFQAAADYCFAYSEDSSVGIMTPRANASSSI